MSSDTDVGQEGVAHSLCSNLSQSCSIVLRTRLGGPVKFFHTSLAHPCLYGLFFVPWCAVRKGLS